MMNPSGPSRKTSYAGSTSKGNARQKKLIKQPSDPLDNSIGFKHTAVKDFYSSSQNFTRGKNCFDVELNGSRSGTSLRRFSQSGVTPASEEFQSVLRDFIPKPEDKPKESKTQSSKTKLRKISFNEFGRASRFAKRLEDISLSPKPKRSIDSLTTPSFIGLTKRPTDHRKFENNGAFAQSRKSLPFHGIKEAWNDPERSFDASNLERRRHVSLPAPPTGFGLDKVSYLQEAVVEPFRPTEKTTRKKSNNNSPSVRKISTVVSPNFSMSEQVSTFEPTHSTHIQDKRKSSSNSVGWNENDQKPIPRKETPPHRLGDVKKKQFVAANGPQDLHPNLLLGIKSKQTGPNDGGISCLEKQLSTEDTAGEQHVAMKAHKNFRRIGKAAIAARRFLKIRNDEAGSHKHAISPLAKEDKEFDEIVKVMKSSYQDLCLDERQGSDLSDEL